MAFKRLLIIGIATIIYGSCAVAWADVKPIDPVVDCKKSIALDNQSDIAKILGGYKTNAIFANGQYVFCFDQTEVSQNPVVLKNVGDDALVIYGLKIKSDPDYTEGWTNKTLLTITGTNVLLQNLQLTGPGSNIAGSIGLALNGSNLSIIDSTITGFETGVKADCVSPAPQPPPLEGGGDSSPLAQNDKASCTIGPKNVIADVKLGVVLPATSQGVTITQNEIRTVFDLDSTTQKIFLKRGANGGLAPPTFSIDPVTMTIWKTLSADSKFVTEIGGVLPKAGAIELFEHREETQIGVSKTRKDYFRASCPTAQNDKGQFEFKCTGLNIDATKGNVFMNVTYAPNTSGMTKWINVKDVPDKIITPMDTISTEGGALTDPSSPAGDSGLVVGGAGGETLAMLDGGGLGGTAPSPQPSPTGGEGELIVDEAQKESSSAAAMTGGAVSIGGDATPSAVGASAGCGGQMMPEKTPANPVLFAILLMPIVLLYRARSFANAQDDRRRRAQDDMKE